jgi:putative ABC transport system permease protein
MIELLLSLKIAVRALRTNKMRSFLTMLGIIIGIAAVIAMIAIGSGASTIISEQIASIGSKILLVRPGSRTSGGLRLGAGSTPTLTIDDARAIRTECPAVALAAPIVRGAAQVVYGNMNWSTAIMGVTPDYLDVRDWPVVEGRNLTQVDVEAATKNCLIGQTVAENLFGAENPVGKIVRIKKIPFTVVGILARKGQSPQGSDQDDIIYIPLRTAQRKVFGSQFPNTVGSIMVQAKSEQDLDRAVEQVTTLLNQRHRMGPSREADFTVRNLSELLEVAEQSSSHVPVARCRSIHIPDRRRDRHHEYHAGLRNRTDERNRNTHKSGAKERDILLQFLTEAVLLTLVGGVIGMALGVAGAKLVSAFFNWPTLISLRAIAMAFGFSGAVGIFFGFYPARKAASLSP